MPRRAGAKNYKNDVLIAIIEEVLPNGELGWDAVALAYQEQTSEETKRDTDDLKRHWIRNLCKGMKKPTGEPGAANDRVLRCIAIERKIMEKTYSGLVGILPDSEAEEKVDEDDDGGDDVDATPRRFSPARLSKTRANASIRSQLASSRVPTATIVDDREVVDEWERQREDENFADFTARIDNPPDYIVDAVTRLQEADGDGLEGGTDGESPCTPTIAQSVSAAMKKAAEATPPLEKSVKDALKRASSLSMKEKTKNSSNKNKERSSIAGTISKVMEKIDSESSDSLMATSMNMMILRQLDAMNRSMERRERRERREKRKKRERRKRQRANDKSKRQAALEDLDDHGGKGSGFLSESSMSDSSISDGSSDQSSGYGRGEWRRKKSSDYDDVGGGNDNGLGGNN